MGFVDSISLYSLRCKCKCTPLGFAREGCLRACCTPQNPCWMFMFLFFFPRSRVLCFFISASYKENTTSKFHLSSSYQRLFLVSSFLSSPTDKHIPPSHLLFGTSYRPLYPSIASFHHLGRLNKTPGLSNTRYNGTHHFFESNSISYTSPHTTSPCQHPSHRPGL